MGGGGAPLEAFLYNRPSYDLMWNRLCQVLPSWKLIGLSLQVSKRSVFIDNLMKQLLHSRLLDMGLVKLNSALRASLAIYHLSRRRNYHNNQPLQALNLIAEYLRDFEMMMK